jgi:hypothetical protein
MGVPGFDTPDITAHSNQNLKSKAQNFLRLYLAAAMLLDWSQSSSISALTMNEPG